MDDDAYWFEPVEPNKRQRFDWGNGAVRFAMLFGVLGMALALFATPFLDRSSMQLAVRDAPYGIDFMTTASVPRQQEPEIYTKRRSVLQSSPTSVCVIRSDGTQTGDC